jgi:Icc-related predicted phosphoesterase
MKYVLIPFLLFISIHIFSQEKSDSAALVNLLAADYKTLGNWDIKTHMENCTENYMLIEGEDIWDMKGEIEYYNKNSNRVIDRKDSFDIKRVSVFGSYAYAVYTLRTDIKENGKLEVKTWLESVLFRKINNKWKIELIHSAPVPIKD